MSYTSIATWLVALSSHAALSVAPTFSHYLPYTPPYRINPGDELSITVWGEDRLKTTVRLLPDGTFNFPLVGQVYAAGRLPSEIERGITAGLRSQYRGSVPNVTVAVRDPTGFQFSVIGKVRAPGAFSPGRYVNALEALSMAGGPSEFAQVGSIRIVRKVGLVSRAIPVRVQGLLRGTAQTVALADIPDLQSGDTLVVP